MKWNRILKLLVLALPVLVVTLAVVAGAATISRSAGDAWAARALSSVALAVMLATVIDLILLVGAMGFKSMDDAERTIHVRRLKRRLRKRRRQKHRNVGPEE